MPSWASSSGMGKYCRSATILPSPGARNLQDLYAAAHPRRGEGGGDLVEGAGRGRFDLEERASGLAGGVGQDRDAAQDLRVELAGHPVTAVAPEDPELFAAIGALHVAHVLDDPDHLEVRLHGHFAGLDGHPRGVGLRGGYYQRFGLGDHLGDGERHVARSRRHVHDDEVGLVPVHVAHELGEGLVDYRGAPDDGLSLVHEVAHGDKLQSLLRFYREDHTVHHVRLAQRAEHDGDRRPVYVGVEYLNGVPGPVERGGEVHGHGALADPALAADHGDDAGPGLVAEGGGELRRAPVQRGEQILAVLVRHHAEVHLDLFDTLDHHEPVLDVRGDPVFQGAARGGERDAHGDARTLYVDGPDHVERDEVASDLGVPHIPQRLPNTGLGEPVGRLGGTIRRFVLAGTFAKPVNHGCRPPPAPIAGDSNYLERADATGQC